MKPLARILWLAAILMLAYGCDDLNPIPEDPDPDPNPGVVHVESVSLGETSLNMAVGDVVTLVATVYPEHATNKNVSWESSNPTIATVDNGVVTAQQLGTAVITVTTEDGEKFANCNISVSESLLSDVENVSDLAYKLNTPADQFTLTWTGVDNAVGYRCWYTFAGESGENELLTIDNGDNTWRAGTNSKMYHGTYTVYVSPIPAEGHSLKEATPASVEIVIEERQVTGLYYRFLSQNVEAGVVYDTACYDLGLKYMNIAYTKPDKTSVVADNWFIYTTTPVENIHHLEMWYGLYYDDEKETIRVYSSTEPGVKQQKLTADGAVMNGYWKVYYLVPEGHKYIYIEGDTKYDYLSRTSSSIYHTVKP